MSLKEAVENSPGLLMNYTKIKNNLEAFKLDNSQIDNTYKTDKNLWIYGPSGIGKTYYATNNFGKVFKKNQNKWWDGYCDEEVVLIDDLDQAFMGTYLKIWADNYSFIGEIKGGSKKISIKLLIVTSNKMPKAIWPDDTVLQMAICRRFRFVTIEGQRPNYKEVAIPNPITGKFL